VRRALLLPHILQSADPAPLPTILLLERDPVDAFFVESLIHRVLRADVWLWHEERLDSALKVLAVTSFRLILLGAPSLPQVSNRQLVRRVHALAPRTPIVLRLPPDQMLSTPLPPRIYGAATVTPKQHAESVLQAVRRVLTLG
jgi:hypothetical protein